MTTGRVASIRARVKDDNAPNTLSFPLILYHLPPSARAVFATIHALAATNEATLELSVREIAAQTRFSPAQVWRALRRLEGARLIKRLGKGKRGKTTWKLLWCTFPQRSVSPPSHSPSKIEKRNSLRETTAPPRGAAWLDFPIRRPSKALRWAMFRLRREVSGWGLPPPRREALLRGLGNAVWRALRKGLVRTTAQLRRLLHEILGHLRDAPEGVSASLRRACSYAGAIVLMSLRAIGALPPRPPEDDRSEQIRRRLELLRRRYLCPWISDAERAEIAAEGRRLRKRPRLNQQNNSGKLYNLLWGRINAAPQLTRGNLGDQGLMP